MKGRPLDTFRARRGNSPLSTRLLVLGFPTITTRLIALLPCSHGSMRAATSEQANNSEMDQIRYMVIYVDFMCFVQDWNS